MDQVYTVFLRPEITDRSDQEDYRAAREIWSKAIQDFHISAGDEGYQGCRRASGGTEML